MVASHRHSKPEEITRFLMAYKSVATTKKIVFTEERMKNIWTLIALNRISPPLEKILSLTYKNYLAGPYKRESGAGNLWEFGLKTDGEDIYIKLCDDFSKDVALCVSFHKPEKPLKFIY